jgi:transposase
MTRAGRRIYTEQTKADAVGQVIKAGLPLRQVARCYEMPERTLENWVRKARLGGAPKPSASASDQEAEISRLKALYAKLRRERDILKKATAYFAKDVL